VAQEAIKYAAAADVARYHESCFEAAPSCHALVFFFAAPVLMPSAAR